MCQILECRDAIYARANFGVNERKLLSELWMAHAELVRHALYCLGNTETRFYADHEHIQRVRKPVAQLLHPPLDEAIQHEVWQEDPGAAGASGVD